MMLENFRDLVSVGYLHKLRLLTQAEQEELRTEGRRILQDTCADQKSQLKTKETTVKQIKFGANHLLVGKGADLLWGRIPVLQRKQENL